MNSLAPMLPSYLKSAFRTIRRQPLYSAVMVGGLAMGLACAMLILLWVRDETGYDRFHRKADLLYRMNWDFHVDKNEGVGPTTPPPLAAAVCREVPGVAAATRLYLVPPEVVRKDGRFFNERAIVAADSNFFELFDFPLLEGDLAAALSAPNSVVLTRSTAQKYFGRADPLGQMLVIGEDRTIQGRRYQSAFRVTGVVQDPPHNSHIRFSLLTSISSHPEVAYFNWSWVWMQVVTYVQMRPGASLAEAAAAIPPMVARLAPPAFKRVGFSYDEIIRNGGRWTFVFQPFTDVYLGSVATGNRLGPVGNRTYVYGLSIIGGFLLLLACINVTNLATARSATRAREIGIRTTLGSERSMLVAQFLTESLVLSALALPVALLAVEIFLGPFNELSGKVLRLDLFDPPWFALIFPALTLLVGLVSGSYPSLYLSALRPALALKPASPPGSSGRRLRDALVVLQFAITTGLIVCTLLVYRQLEFIRSTDLGFVKEGVLVVSNENNRLGGRAELFTARIKQCDGVLDASVTTGVPPEGGFEDYYKVEGRGDQQVTMISYMTDESFLPALGIGLSRGRNFVHGSPANASSVILNEAAVHAFGWSDPVGKTITYPSAGTYTVIGVMKDFNFEDLRSPVTPFALFHAASKSYQITDSYVAVRIRREETATALAALEKEWKAIAPLAPFEYRFLDESLEAAYLADHRVGAVFLAFSLLTIVIASIGLLALAAFTTERRTKEIGVRRVLGASSASVVRLLVREFLALVLLANVAAWPAAWFVIDGWLRQFAYRAPVAWWAFAGAGCLALLIALLTVSGFALQAARLNPVHALRYE